MCIFHTPHAVPHAMQQQSDRYFRIPHTRVSSVISLGPGMAMYMYLCRKDGTGPVLCDAVALNHSTDNSQYGLTKLWITWSSLFQK